MKLGILNVINTAAATAINTIANVVNDLRLEGDEREQWQRLVPYGEYPATIQIDGRPTAIMQVLDRSAGELMAENQATVINQLRHLGRGLPIYIGHPDNRDWLAQNPGADSSSKGRIKALEAREDGVYMLTVFNDDGRALIGGDAPPFSAQSPNWDMVPISEGSKRYRPFVLRSIGLTNQPNIPECAIGLNTAGANEPSQSEAAGAADEPETPQNDDMKLTADALKALGFAPDATPSNDEISAAIVKMLGEKAAAEAAKATAETSLTAANTRATTAETELTNLRSSTVATAINSALTEGRITEAERPTWEGLLKADPVNGAAALAKVGKATAINTANKIGDLGLRKGEGATAAASFTAINDAVGAYAKEHGLDLKKQADYDKAFAEVRAAKPEIFGDEAKA